MIPAPHPPHPATITLLVVDDRPTSRELMARTLGREGYRVLEAADGAEALEAVARHPPDLVLLDVMMPGMNGFEVLERIRANHPWPRVAVILLSALQTGPEDQARALDAGAEGFIARPVDPRELTARIRSHLRTLFLARDLEASEARARELTDLLDQARDAIYVLDPDGVVLAWSGGAERMYGVLEEEAVGRPLGALVLPEREENPDALDLLREQMEASLAAGSWTGELQHRTRDGRRITVEGRWSVVRGSTPQATRVICVNTDVTDRRRLLEVWQRAERLESLGMLAGGLAHDLNNALQPLALAAEALVVEAEADPRIRELARTVEVQARRSAERVERLLHLSRSLEGTRSAIPLAPLLEGILAEVRGDVGHRISLVLEAPASGKEAPEGAQPAEGGSAANRASGTPNPPGVISGNPDLLRQLFSCLLRNAVEAFPPGAEGSIRVTVGPASPAPDDRSPFFARTGGRGIEVRIQDTGEGMTPEVLEQALEPLFTTRESMGHTGLGLTVAHRIVRVHGGELHLESAPGEGTTVRVLLPAAGSGDAGLPSEGDAEDPAPAHEPETARDTGTAHHPGTAHDPAPAHGAETPPPGSPNPDGSPNPRIATSPEGAPTPELPRGRLVLVVDDDPAIRMVTRRALTSHGFLARAAAGGEEALALLREDPGAVGLVIVDMMMPGMDGPATLRALRAVRPELPAIGVSGLLEPPAGPPGEEGSQVDHFLPKPFSVAQLLETVRRFVEPSEG